MYLNWYSKAMARSSKQLEPLDEAIVDILNQIVSDAGLSRRDLVTMTGLGLNRLGIILRGELRH